MRLGSALTFTAFAVATLLVPGAALGRVDEVRPVCQATDGYAKSFEGRRTFLWRPEALQASRARMMQAPRDAALAKVLADAEAALTAGPWSVVDKTRPPASGDRHDYASMGPYWWPDAGKPAGAPYVRRDGDINPERDGAAFDLKRMEAMSSAVEALALGYTLTDDPRYAKRVARVVRTWFLDPATRMNPNMDHAQSIPGRTPGRAEGVIDLRHLMPVIEAVGLIGPSGELDDAEQAALREWFSRMTVWLATSALGREERAAANNHGIFYDLLLMHFALFAGHGEVAAKVAGDFPRRRIGPQFAADGSLPNELARTRSFHYSTWTMGAAFDLATLAECVGTDLWRAEVSGRGLPGATAFLSSYAGRETQWKWPEKKPDTREFYVALRKAAWGYRDPALTARAEQYAARHAGDRIDVLVPAWPPAQPDEAVR